MWPYFTCWNVALHHLVIGGNNLVVSYLKTEESNSFVLDVSTRKSETTMLS